MLLASLHAAHSLEGRVEARALDWIDTAARYEATHALALLGVAILIGREDPAPLLLRLSAWAFAAGMAAFCGPLYLMGVFGWRALGVVVPFGGVALLAAWLLLGLYGWRRVSDPLLRGALSAEADGSSQNS